MDIRNFVIISHIDHGKSTLADRFLELTGTIEARHMKPQYLDQLELERERGITIKMAPVRMAYVLNAIPYTLNLIDTPGHNDFSYEVSRALATVEGAILLVDVTKGIQAQTLANFELAKKAGLKIIGAVNKVDIKSSQIKNTVKEIANLIGCSEEEIFRISGKTGEGVEKLLEAVIKFIPTPSEAPLVFREECLGVPISLVSDRNRTYRDESQAAARHRSEPTAVPSETPAARALIFDSFYNEHKGVIAAIRIFNGEINIGEEVFFIATEQRAKVKEVGYFVPDLKPAQKLSGGEIGYLATGIKDPEKLKIGDTIIMFKVESSKLKVKDLALPGYQEPQPVVFVSFYPEDSNQYENLKKAFQKLKLNDSSLKIEGDFNEALGRGFKVGFLGKLHFEITAERLEIEFGVKTVNTFPSVAYKIKDKSNYLIIENPYELAEHLEEIWEPMAKLEIITPIFYLGNILQLKDIYRWSGIKTKNLGESGEKILILAKMPLAELISDFDSQLKSVSAGFASYSYEIIDFEKSDLVKMEIWVAGKPVPGLVKVIFRRKLAEEARLMTEKLKKLLPRQQFSQAVQAVSEGKIIARETIPAIRKDVTGYLYGGDRSRKMKLWQKQKQGKKKLLQMAGKIKIPIKVFKNLLK